VWQLIRSLIERMRDEQEKAVPASDDGQRDAAQDALPACAAAQEAADALEALRRSIVLDAATGLSNAIFVQICAPYTAQDGKDDEALVTELQSHLDSALLHLHASSAADAASARILKSTLP
jgi:hypothetical protein